ncbi:MAG: cation:proton antiporter, partial [Pseudomonadota bacterium]
FGILQLTLGPLVGLAAGFVGGKLIDVAVRREWMLGDFTGPAALALALACYSIAELVGGNGFIGAFVGGLTFGAMVRDHCHTLFEFAEAEGQLLTLITFLLFGAFLLPEAIQAFSWPIFLYAVLSLTVVRMVPVAISLIGAGLRWQTVGFLGWFGPRGLASLLFVLLILKDTHGAANHTIMVTVVTTVTLSTLLHGLSASIGARWYANSLEKADQAPEHAKVKEMRTRVGDWLRHRRKSHQEGQ